ncbi:MAG: phosphotransferase [Deltaproteobacteria bacterium]|nr:phosphotransferase [Deltaproteobacteria bacterium]MBI4224292.1 phosphotransferase [Deltaproteobacteria bacterium]
MKEKIVHTEKLFGEASYRVYSRITTESGKTYIQMQMPKGQKMSASEEITNIRETPKELPTINIQRYLKKLGLPVPEIISFDKEAAQVVLEDLGDTKLEDIVTGAKPDTLIGWYKKAIDLLVDLQTKANADTRCIAFARSFDATLFNWEFEHFWEWCGRTTDQQLFQQETKKITQELCRLPQGFTHRDYQSRNLMVKNDKLYMIDFQDALLGPKVYDVVCLLRDSYVDVTPRLEDLLGYYCEKSKEDLKKFRRRFDLQTVQRKLKDAGRFVYIDKVKKNPNFLKHIPLSLDYVQQALARLPEYKELHALLQKHS